MNLTNPKRRRLANDGQLNLIELGAVVKYIFSNWLLILVCGVVGLSATYLINRYTANVYDISATIAIDETENPLSSSIDGMLNLGLGLGANSLVETRLAIIKSYAHNLRVVQKLDWAVKYRNKGRLNSREVYQPPHFNIVYDKTHVQCDGVEFNINFEQTHFTITTAVQSEWINLYDYSLCKSTGQIRRESFIKLILNM